MTGKTCRELGLKLPKIEMSMPYAAWSNEKMKDQAWCLIRDKSLERMRYNG